MNVENLKNSYPKLLSHMEDSGYSKKYIYTFRREIQWIISEAGLRSWECYGDMYRDYQANSSPHNILKRNTQSSALSSSSTFTADIPAQSGIILRQEVRTQSLYPSSGR